MPEGLDTMSLSDALAAAKAELEPASSNEGETGMPPVEPDASSSGEQASVDPSEQPAAESNDGLGAEASALGDALMDTTEESQNGSDPGTVVPGSDDFWNLPVEVQTVNGQETVTIQELSNGYLRQADYTQKTQGLAEDRKHTERATQFLDAFESDPAGFTRSLAVQAGYIQEGDEPVREIPNVKIPSQEDLDARVNELVEERIGSDPRVQTAEVAAAQAQVDVEFDRLQTEYQVELKPALRESLIQEAIQTGSPDLESVLTKRLVRLQQQQSKAGSANLASTSRPGSAPVGATTPEEGKTVSHPTMREAWQQAKVATTQQ